MTRAPKKPAKLHKGKTWAVMRLPWTGFRDMISGFDSQRAAEEWATAHGYEIVP